MATKDKDGKLTYEMTSPGEAYMNFVDSKEGHNAASVTPSYLSNQNQNVIKKPDLYYEAMKEQKDADKNEINKERSKETPEKER